MATQASIDTVLPQWKKAAKQVKDVSRLEEEKKPVAAKITESAKPILEEQALLREKLKTMPSWKKDKEIVVKRKIQPMVARPPSPGTGASANSARLGSCQPGAVFTKAPSPPTRRRTPGNSPNNSGSFHFPRSGSPISEVSNDFKRKVEKAMRARLYLLQQTGPNSFLIGGDSPDHKFRVMIGPQSCTCTRPHCVHVLFVMLRVFKLKDNDPLLWSLKLKNFEVEKLLSKFHARLKSRLSKDMTDSKISRSKDQEKPPSPSPNSSSLGISLPNAREEEEVCPICLLEMVEGESLMSCRDGCNNRLHQHCMEVWANECKRQREALLCPLCRKTWSSAAYRTQSHRLPPDLPSVPAPLGPEEITLPHSDPVPASQVEIAKPWIEAFGENLVCCLFSREWNARETALRRLSKDITASFVEGSNVQKMSAFQACCSLLSMMCGDPVYRVYVAALRTLRVLTMHTSYPTQEERKHLQKCLFGVVDAVLTKCSDSNRRRSALSVKVLLELCKDENGDLALGKMLGDDQEVQPLGGLNFILSCILRVAAEYSTWPWWLGRLLFLRKLLDEYVAEFQLASDISLPVQMDAVGVLMNDRVQDMSCDTGEVYQDNLTRLMSVLKFTMQAVNCSHSRVSKLAIIILISCTSLALHCAPASRYIAKVVSKLSPAQRSALKRKMNLSPSSNTVPISLQEREGIESQLSEESPSLTSTNRDSAIGSLSSLPSDYETENLSDSELQSMEDMERPHSMLLSPCLSPSKDISLDWSRSFEDSPRMPPVRFVVGKKCQDIIEQEEAEAVAKAMAVSSQYPVPSKIESLDTGDEMVIVFTQPDSLEKAVNSKHLYLEGVHWKKGELLGTGAYSSCYAVRDLMNGSLMAVKQVSFCRNSTEEQEKVTHTIEDEISLLGRLQHPHLIKCLGATKHTGHFNIFLEWMPGGSITKLLQRYGPFDERIVISYSKQVLQGVAYLHQNQVIHRDIKGANILVDSTGQNIRIADFGAAARLATQMTGAGEFQGQLLGTVAFMAPEVLRGESYGRSCDVWSVGCVVIEMTTGKPPWNAHEHSNHLALIFKIACAESPPEIPGNLNPALRDVLLRCLEGKSEERPSAMDLLRHPLFTQM
ncbi:mitogen-activated protein kinase kinase kinase 1-like isoform X1 [Acropora muricata]|uniref:mitogen-activated protein kinase kinase kinase 1-like isoform X1 n=1 Tax=Acropora muricata TaxID=159855 RepID=UPI0034E3D3AD